MNTFFWGQILLVMLVLWPVAVALTTAGLNTFGPGTDFTAVWRKKWFAIFWSSAPVPGVGLALAGLEAQVEMSWLLLGGTWEAYGIRIPVLGFTALLWTAAGIFAQGYMAAKVQKDQWNNFDSGRHLFLFALCWPLALAGNLLLIVAQDIAGFYTGYVLMTFAAYVLVIQDQTWRARQGGRAYLIMAVIGEAMVLAGILWGAGSTQALMLSEMRQGLAGAAPAAPISWLLWLGFGVKAGVWGLHVWLPMAHPVAPTPASAVLSGAMIKAGLLGWYYTLPMGLLGLPWLGQTAVVLGLTGAFAAALYGVFQSEAKVVLAYSSVSQMGMITSLFGLGLTRPDLWSQLWPVLFLFAMHHALNKGALFMGTAITDHQFRLSKWLIWLLLVLPALSLAGVFGSGAVTKYMLKSFLSAADNAFLAALFSLAATGTTLLMLRTLGLQYRQWRNSKADNQPGLLPESMLVSWSALVLAAAGCPWWLYRPEGFTLLHLGNYWLDLLWPVASGLVLVVVARQMTTSIPVFRTLAQGFGHLPEGDLWFIFSRPASRAYYAAKSYRDCLDTMLAQKSQYYAQKSEHFYQSLLDVIQRQEIFLRTWAGVLMAVLAMLLTLILLQWS